MFLCNVNQQSSDCMKSVFTLRQLFFLPPLGMSLFPAEVLFDVWWK